MGNQKSTISRERLGAPPSDLYAETILRPAFEFKRRNFFQPLIDTHVAWTTMLAGRDIIPRSHASRIVSTLWELSDKGGDALGSYNPTLEYFYSHVEHYLTIRLGENVAGNINIGRTRPEPLARMVIRERLIDCIKLLQVFQHCLLTRAAVEVETVMPQWTHYQPAQPATLGYYLLAIADSLSRHQRRLRQAFDTVNVCTLGCGALAGTSYPIDRACVASLLGFTGYKENALDCVASEEHLIEPVAALAGMMATVSRMCQDFHVWSTHEFGFVEIEDAYAGSSSMMPQKKNPYPFEYVRARAAQVIAHSASVHEIVHNTPFQDLKDVEEEGVYPLFDAFDLCSGSLRLLDAVVDSTAFRRERMRALAASGYSTSTELAAVIHRRFHVSYRTAHRIVGAAISQALRAPGEPAELTRKHIEDAATQVTGTPLDISDVDVLESLDPLRFVEAQRSPGGTAPTEVRRMLSRRVEELQKNREDVDELERRLADARARLHAESRCIESSS